MPETSGINKAEILNRPLAIQLHGENWYEMIPSPSQIEDWTKILFNNIPTSAYSTFPIEISNNGYDSCHREYISKDDIKRYSKRFIPSGINQDGRDNFLAANLIIHDIVRNYISKNTVDLPVTIVRKRSIDSNDRPRTYPVVFLVEGDQSKYPIEITEPRIYNVITSMYSAESMQYSPLIINIKAHSGIPENEHFSRLVLEKLLDTYRLV